jgi:hypothetical protein
VGSCGYNSGRLYQVKYSRCAKDHDSNQNREEGTHFLLVSRHRAMSVLCKPVHYSSDDFARWAGKYDAHKATEIRNCNRLMTPLPNTRCSEERYVP